MGLLTPITRYFINLRNNVGNSLRSAFGQNPKQQPSQPDQDKPQESKNFADFLKSVIKSEFVRETTQTAFKQSYGLIDNLVFGASIALGAATLGPIGAAGAGVIVHHLQERNKGLNKIKGIAAKTRDTVSTAGGAALGATLGVAFGPIGLAAGAAIGGITGRAFSRKLGQLVNQTLRPLGSAPGSPNAVTYFTDYLSATITNNLRISFKNVSKILVVGCISFPIIIIFIIVSMVGIFVTPRLGPSIGPETTTPSFSTCGQAIAYQAELIANQLQPGFWNFFNHSLMHDGIDDNDDRFNEDYYERCPFPPYNEPGPDANNCTRPAWRALFWCVDLVSQAYSMAGYYFPEENGYHSVASQRSWFIQNNSYAENGSIAITSENLVGAAVIFGNEKDSYHHIAIVTKVTSDYITIVEANNAPSTTRGLTVSQNGTMIQGGVHGFGLPICN